eukprot:TRINITY_DN23694_c0_g1_i1.p1 TRINITY_DN23694_c0_g1~~TRINITY_DN23694_c0_g1_i1.p1  ORF type:complete len:455 (-),score=81.32 TRINITY_DN23694_c0_g1_i1:133-1497(-)
MSSPFNVSKMPKMKICYICGREFGSTSLPIHQKQCLKKREIEQSRLPKHLRTPLRKPEETGNNANDRDAAFDAYQTNLVPCKQCGRTFLPDRLQVHARSCRGPSKPRTGATPRSSASGGARATSPRRSSPAAASASSPAAAASSSSSIRRTSGRGPGGSQRSAAAAPADEDEDLGPPPPKAEYVIPDDPNVVASVGGLVPCNVCGRKFAPDRIDKHENACKIAHKKRKVVDPSKMRTAGTEMKAVKSTASSAAAAAGSKGGKTNWRAKHAEFQKAMKAAREVGKALKTGGPLPEYEPSAPDPSYVQCPHCMRRFNETAAARHIPHCAKTINKPKPPPALRKGAGTGASSRSSGATSARSSTGARSGPVSARRPVQSSGYGRTSSSTTGRATSPRRGAPSTTTRTAGARTGARTGARAASGGSGRPASFCGDCGTKYSTSSQKFCGDCGTKRIGV